MCVFARVAMAACQFVYAHGRSAWVFLENLAPKSNALGSGHDRSASRPPAQPRGSSTMLNAAIEVVSAHGYAGTSMDRIAARAGVALQSVYLRWPNKAPLVAEAIMSMYSAGVVHEVPISDDIAADMRAWLRQNTARGPGAVSGTLAFFCRSRCGKHAGDSDELFQQLGEPYIASILRRLRHGVATAQVRPDADLESVADAVIGASLYRVMAGDSSPDDTDEKVQQPRRGADQRDRTQEYPPTA